jgi:hypothetical protein
MKNRLDSDRPSHGRRLHSKSPAHAHERTHEPSARAGPRPNQNQNRLILSPEQGGRVHFAVFIYHPVKRLTLFQACLYTHAVIAKTVVPV